MIQNRGEIPAALISVFLILSSLCCKKEENNADLIAIGPAVGLTGFPLYTLDGTVNLDYSQNCGTATKESTGTTQTGTGAETYRINAFYFIDVGKSPVTFNYPLYTADLTLRFKHDPSRSSYSFNPLSTVFTTCNTKDHLSCDTTGTLTCDTVDGIKCGGVDAFIFTATSSNQLYGNWEIAFQAVTGTIDWSRGLNLNTQGTIVQDSTLEFSMIGKMYSTCNTIDSIDCNTAGTLTCETGDGVKCGGIAETNIFKGKISCKSPAI